MCQGPLKHYDRRTRKAIDKQGKPRQYSLRRLRCQACGKMHLELPDFLLPYKRYEAVVIVDVVTQDQVSMPYEERTIKKIKRWFAKIKSALQGVWHRLVVSGFASPDINPNLLLMVKAAVNSGFWSYHPYGH